MSSVISVIREGNKAAVLMQLLSIVEGRLLLHQDHDSDGEDAAGSRLGNLLHTMVIFLFLTLVTWLLSVLYLLHRTCKMFWW
jgi:hypothetical protein